MALASTVVHAEKTTTTIYVRLSVSFVWLTTITYDELMMYEHAGVGVAGVQNKSRITTVSMYVGPT